MVCTFAGRGVRYAAVACHDLTGRCAAGSVACDATGAEESYPELVAVTYVFLCTESGHLLFLSNPAICFELSYRFMSPTFGVAFLLSILGVWCFEKIKSPIASVLAGAACISFSMGAYQAYICCTTVAFLTALLLLMKLSKNVNWRGLLLFALNLSREYLWAELDIQ